MCFYLQRTKKKELVLIAIECRISDTDSSTIVSDKEIEEKAEKTRNNVENTFGNMICQTFFVFCPWRNPSFTHEVYSKKTTPYSFGKIGKEVPILYLLKKDLDNLFGPLSPQFWWDWRKQV